MTDVKSSLPTEYMHMQLTELYEHECAVATRLDNQTSHRLHSSSSRIVCCASLGSDGTFLSKNHWFVLELNHKQTLKHTTPCYCHTTLGQAVWGLTLDRANLTRQQRASIGDAAVISSPEVEVYQMEQRLCKASLQGRFPVCVSITM